MEAVHEVLAVAGRGLEGDRYFQPAAGGEPDQEITLIESEAITAAASESGVDIRPEDARRNVAFAKRQRTWFRAEPDVVWLDAARTDPFPAARDATRAILGRP